MAHQTFRGGDFYQNNEVNFLVNKGYLVAGATAGTYKLSAKGLTEADKILNALDSKHKVFLKLKIAGNADTDVKTLF